MCCGQRKANPSTTKAALLSPFCWVSQREGPPGPQVAILSRIRYGAMVDSVIQHAPRTFVSHRCFDTGRWDKTRQGSFASPEPMPWKVLKRGQFDRHQTDRGRGEFMQRGDLLGRRLARLYLHALTHKRLDYVVQYNERTNSTDTEACPRSSGVYFPPAPTDKCAGLLNTHASSWLGDGRYDGWPDHRCVAGKGVRAL